MAAAATISQTPYLIREPHTQEWAACRMLLPQAFTTKPAPECYLALDPDHPRVLGALTYRRGEGVTYGVRLRVVRTHRRRGIGSALLKRLIEESQEAGDKTLVGPVESLDQTEAAPFLAAHGFERSHRLTTVEADLAEMRLHLLKLRSIVEKRGSIPQNVRFVPLADVSGIQVDQVAKLYAEYIAHNPDMPSHGVRNAIKGNKLDDSFVMLVDGRAEGILLMEISDGTGMIHARVVSERYRSRGWANTMLLNYGLERGWPKGMRRVRFDIPEGNRDTEKLSRRFAANAVEIRDRYALRLDN